MRHSTIGDHALTVAGPHA